MEPKRLIIKMESAPSGHCQVPPRKSQFPCYSASITKGLKLTGFNFIGVPLIKCNEGERSTPRAVFYLDWPSDVFLYKKFDCGWCSGT